MIIKLGHVSFSCEIGEIESVRAGFPLYEEIFREKIKNLGIKAEFCNSYSAEHELMLLNPRNAALIPIEITAYEKVLQQEKLVWIDENTIHVFTNSIQDCMDFFEVVGFKKESDHKLCFSSLFHPQNVIIELHQRQCVPEWKLDTRGWGCIAFVCDSAERQRRKMQNQVYCTPLDQLEVNGNLLNIFFAKGKNGELVEIYSLQRP